MADILPKCHMKTAVHATMHASDLSADAESEWTFMMLSGQVEPRDVNIAAETAGSSGPGGSATKIFTDLELHRQRVRFQLDTGASCNVIGRHMLPPEAHLKPTNKVLALYDHSTVAPMGIHTTYVRNPKTGTQHCLDLAVVQSAKATPLLLAIACQEMKLIIVCHENIQDNSQTTNSELHTTATMSRNTITPRQKKESWSNMQTSSTENLDDLKE